MIIGYARISTTEQNLDLQRDALKRAGCGKIIEDTVSGGKVQRPALERVHDALRSGDVLDACRLDRLGPSVKHLVELMAELEAERIGFQSVTESIDTTTPGGKLVFHIFGALAEFERNLIRARTYAGDMVQKQVTPQGWLGSTPGGRRPQIRGFRTGGSLAVANSTPATLLLSPAKMLTLNHAPNARFETATD